MVLRYTADTAAAAWLASSRTPAEQLITFGPADYEAYARLRYIPDPTSPDQRETDADVPADRELWTPQARRALHVLAPFTATPDQCFFCVWEGVAGSALSAAERQGPLVTVPHRRYVLFTGRLADYIEGRAEPFDGDSAPVPAFVWPADRRWCFTSDVDPHWAGIGADQAAVDRLLATVGLDVVQAMPTERLPAYR
ncbi:hypothetical protein [Micromonospora arborensis]|uniref:hypothetical protein n=1 Tax=Micromonospora arborensis TaxID=2116518 RepID=UPI0037233303